MLFKTLLLLVSILNISFAEISDFDISGSSSIQYQQDQIREQVNSNETNITNLSIIADSFMDKKKKEMIRVELLGEENTLTNDLNLTVGEVFYQRKDLINNLNLRAGLMKLGYGLLNPIDGAFARLPSYYQFLYNLPRGIDMGLQTEFKINKHISFGGGAFLGRTVRNTDNFQPKAESPPLHFFSKLKINKDNSFRLHYVSRNFEQQPSFSSFGIDYQGLFKLYAFNFKLNSEVWRISSGTNTNQESTGETFLLSPKLTYKKFYISSVLSYERWSIASNNQQDEFYRSLRAGVNLSKSITLELEQLNVSGDELEKDDFFLARVLLSWGV